MCLNPVNEEFDRAYANVGLLASDVWSYQNEEVDYKKANLYLWIRFNETEKRLIEDDSSDDLSTSTDAIYTVQDVIPFSRLAKYNNFEYNEGREKIYVADDEPPQCIQNSHHLGHKDLEVWMLPEVEKEFKRYTKGSQSGWCMLSPRYPSGRELVSIERITNASPQKWLSETQWPNRLLFHYAEKLYCLKLSTDPSLFRDDLEPPVYDPEEVEMKLLEYPCPKYLVETNIDHRLHEIINSPAIRNLWATPSYPYGSYSQTFGLNAEVPEFQPVAFSSKLKVEGENFDPVHTTQTSNNMHHTVHGFTTNESSFEARQQHYVSIFDMNYEAEVFPYSSASNKYVVEPETMYMETNEEPQPNPALNPPGLYFNLELLKSNWKNQQDINIVTLPESEMIEVAEQQLEPWIHLGGGQSLNKIQNTEKMIAFLEKWVTKIYNPRSIDFNQMSSSSGRINKIFQNVQQGYCLVQGPMPVLQQPAQRPLYSDVLMSEVNPAATSSESKFDELEQEALEQYSGSDTLIPPPPQQYSGSDTLIPPPPQQYSGSDMLIPPLPQQYSGSDTLIPHPPQQYSGFDTLIPPPSQQYSGSDTLIPPPPQQYSGSDMLISPPPQQYSGSDTLIPPPPKQYSGSDMLIPPPPQQYSGFDTLIPPPPQQYSGSDTLIPPPPQQVSENVNSDEKSTLRLYSQDLKPHILSSPLPSPERDKETRPEKLFARHLSQESIASSRQSCASERLRQEIESKLEACHSNMQVKWMKKKKKKSEKKKKNLKNSKKKQPIEHNKKLVGSEIILINKFLELSNTFNRIFKLDDWKLVQDGLTVKIKNTFERCFSIFGDCSEWFVFLITERAGCEDCSNTKNRIDLMRKIVNLSGNLLGTLHKYVFLYNKMKMTIPCDHRLYFNPEKLIRQRPIVSPQLHTVSLSENFRCNKVRLLATVPNGKYFLRLLNSVIQEERITLSFKQEWKLPQVVETPVNRRSYEIQINFKEWRIHLAESEMEKEEPNSNTNRKLVKIVEDYPTWYSWQWKFIDGLKLDTSDSSFSFHWCNRFNVKILEQIATSARLFVMYDWILDLIDAVVLNKHFSSCEVLWNRKIPNLVSSKMVFYRLLLQKDRDWYFGDVRINQQACCRLYSGCENLCCVTWMLNYDSRNTIGGPSVSLTKGHRSRVSRVTVRSTRSRCKKEETKNIKNRSTSKSKKSGSPKKKTIFNDIQGVSDKMNLPQERSICVIQ